MFSTIMKLIKLITLPVLFTLFSLTIGCNDKSDSKGSGNKLTKIVVIGDSIGTGFGVATGFPVFLKQMAGVPLINNSKRSRQTGTGIGLAKSLIAQHKPSHLVVLLGTNDAVRGSVGAAINNLQTIANIAKDNGVTCVIGTLPPIPRSSASNSKAAAISKGIQGLKNARIANIRGELGNGDIADGVHPNNNGQRIIAMNFKEKL